MDRLSGSSSTIRIAVAYCPAGQNCGVVHFTIRSFFMDLTPPTLWVACFIGGSLRINETTHRMRNYEHDFHALY
jgi:hypothetical protein